MRKSTSYVLVSLILMMGIILTSLIFSYTYSKIENDKTFRIHKNKIDVIGYSELNFPANIIKFHSKLSKDKYKELRTCLLNAGINHNSIKQESADEIIVETEYIREIESVIDNQDNISYFQLATLKREYYCTNIEDVKIKLLMKATKNARSKAGTIAEYSGNKLGVLVHSDSGKITFKDMNNDREFNSLNELNKSKKRKIAKMKLNQTYIVK